MIDNEEFYRLFSEFFEQEVVKGYSYYWKESPDVGFFGPKNGAIFKLSIYPSIYPAVDFDPMEPSVTIDLEVTWYFHIGPGAFEQLGVPFSEGPMKKFNDSSRYHIQITDYGNIEPGHYMFAITCRARDRVKMKKGFDSKKLLGKINKIIRTFQEVISEL